MTVKGVTGEDGREDGEMNWEGGGQEAGRIREERTTYQELWQEYYW